MKSPTRRMKVRPASTPDPDRPPQKQAVGLIQDARSYWMAAQIVEEADADGVERGASRLLTPGYFLVCHAIELTLKAYYLSQGGAQDRLRIIGHDLTKAMEQAETLGFVVEDERFWDVAARLTQYHREHWFRYRALGWFSLPILHEVIDATESALDYVEPIVRANALKVLNAEVPGIVPAS